MFAFLQRFVPHHTPTIHPSQRREPVVSPDSLPDAPVAPVAPDYSVQYLETALNFDSYERLFLGRVHPAAGDDHGDRFADIIITGRGNGKPTAPHDGAASGISQSNQNSRTTEEGIADALAVLAATDHFFLELGGLDADDSSSLAGLGDQFDRRRQRLRS